MNKKTSGRYTEEFKKASIKYAIESDRPIAVVARELGIGKSTLHEWVSRSDMDARNSVNTEIDSNPSEELKRLRKENARLKMERDILKKATAYFASEGL
jgi:transposase